MSHKDRFRILSNPPDEEVESVLASGEYPCPGCSNVVVDGPLYRHGEEWLCTICHLTFAEH